MTKYKLLLLLTFLLAQITVQAQSKTDTKKQETIKPETSKPETTKAGNTNQASEKQAILQVLETQRTAWNKGDLENYMQGYWKSDSLLFVGKSGATYGWQKTLDNYKRGYPDKAAMGELIFGIKKVEFLSVDQAFILGSWLLKREKDELKGYFTLIFRKVNGKWVIVSDHSS